MNQGFRVVDQDYRPQTAQELRGVCHTLAHLLSECVQVMRTIDPDDGCHPDQLRALIAKADLAADNVHLWPAAPASQAHEPMEPDPAWSAEVAEAVQIMGDALGLARRAARIGRILTVEQCPMQPLMQGNYKTNVIVQRGRGVVGTGRAS